jgi:protein-S-isoprenylcysteine O-methyltransferase Ste14
VTAHQSTSGVRIFPPAIHVLAIAIGFLLQWAVPLRMPESLRPVMLAGYVVLAIAVGLMAWSVIGMSRAGTTPNPTRPTTALLTYGPYRLTRNPMYFAWELVCVGVGLAANAPWVIVMALPAALVTLRLVIDKEERYLETKFGGEYRDYKARVRRWI